jgi:PAC2 family
MPEPSAIRFHNTATLDQATLDHGTLLLALTGWMDGGSVSTGTVQHLMQGRQLVNVADLNPAGFYIDNFPGSMEISALFRPHVKYSGGVIENFTVTDNKFLADPKDNLAFFLGKEPNLNWTAFADAIFEMAHRLKVARIVFVGSFGGAVPHTREPRLYGSVSERGLLNVLREHQLKPTEYEGPASFASYLLSRAPGQHLQMVSIACEIPGYLQGPNPNSISAVARRVARIIGIQTDVSELRQAADSWEQQVTEAVDADEDLAKTVKKLEEDYDNDLVTQLEDPEAGG